MLLLHSSYLFTDSVEFGEKLVETAIKEFGRLGMLFSLKQIFKAVIVISPPNKSFFSVKDSPCLSVCQYFS